MVIKKKLKKCMQFFFIANTIMVKEILSDCFIVDIDLRNEMTIYPRSVKKPAIIENMGPIVSYILPFLRKVNPIHLHDFAILVII